MSSSPNLRRIRAFVAVAELRSVSAAARLLNLTPPAISKSIRELEATLRAQLLDRTSKGMVLTPAGEAYVLRAKLALSELEKGAQEIAVLKGAAENRVVVGALPNGSQPIVPLAVANVLKIRPVTRFSIRGGRYEAFVTALRAGEMELFVGSLPTRDGPEGLVTEVLFDDELAVIVRPDHPLVGQTRITVNQLARQKWMLPDLGGSLRERIEQAFERAGLERPSDWLEATQLGAMRTILRETDFIAVSARMRVREELDLGLLRELPVKLPGVAESVVVVHRPEVSMSRGGRLLLDQLRLLANPKAFS